MIERLQYVLRHYLLQPHLEMVGILDAVRRAARTNDLIDQFRMIGNFILN